MQSVIVECKLPKGHKWTDSDVIKEPSPYGIGFGYGKYCCFYPIGEDLYIRGMFSKLFKEERKIKNIVVELTNYKNLTGIEAWNVLSNEVITESMILNVWNKLGLKLGFMKPVLKDLR